MKKNNAKIIVIFLFLIIYSCNPVKKVPKHSYLLQQNTIIENGEKLKDENISSYLLQKPNSRVLGLPLWLFIYNASDEKSKEKYEKWLERNPRTHRFLNFLLSKKQVNRLGNSFLISGKDNLLKSLGDAPIILDTLKTHKTAQTLKAYYRSNGYFNAQVRYNILENPDKKQQASVTYNINTGSPYVIDSLSSKIESAELDSIYKKHIKKRILQKNQQYSLQNFAKERERLNTIFRNEGFYTFEQSAINFNIKRDTILANNDKLISVQTEIANFTDRTDENPIQKPYLIHRLNKINVYTDYDFSNQEPYDTIQYKDITFHFRNKLRFHRKTLYNAIALHKNDIYKDDARTSTYRQLSNLRVFRYPNIQYTYAPADTLQRTLDANIYLTPLPRFSLELNSEITHSDIQSFGIGFGASVQAKNIFRGAEILEIGLRGTLGAQTLLEENTRFFNVFEYGADARLMIPRIWFFVNTDKIIPYSMLPQTILQGGITIQENIGLDKNKLQGVLRYTWNPTPKNRSILELVDAEYIKNLKPQNFYGVYQSTYRYLNQIAKNHQLGTPYTDANGNLDINHGIFLFKRDALSQKLPLSQEEYERVFSISERFARLTHNDLIMATSFSYIINNSVQYATPSFQQFRIKVETAGNFPQLLSRLLKNEKDAYGQRQFFGISYAQYAKTEFEYIKHWDLGYENVLAFRTFVGMAIPYGNGKNIPFSRSYFAGGSNDNRAWRAYSLGPGRSGSILDFNEANFKFTANLEYRFPIKGAFKGALFADAGNIWNIFDDIEDTTWKLDKWSDVQDIALGTGLGLRYDFNYFVLRLDLGVKTYNPAKEIEHRWIKRLALNDFVFNIGINYPF